MTRRLHARHGRGLRRLHDRMNNSRLTRSLQASFVAFFVSQQVPQFSIWLRGMVNPGLEAVSTTQLLVWKHASIIRLENNMNLPPSSCPHVRVYQLTHRCSTEHTEPQKVGQKAIRENPVGNAVEFRHPASSKSTPPPQPPLRPRTPPQASLSQTLTTRRPDCAQTIAHTWSTASISHPTAEHCFHLPPHRSMWLLTVHVPKPCRPPQKTRSLSLGALRSLGRQGRWRRGCWSRWLAATWR